MSSLNLIIIITALLLVAPLAAHDMWIQPATFTPAPGQIVALKLRVGQDLLGDALPRNSALIKDFFVDDGSSVAPHRKQTVGRDGSDPAGLFRVDKPGLTIAGYWSNASPVDVSAEKFNQYLKDEGLDAVLAQRMRANQLGANVHELFTRCAKSLLVSRDADEAATSPQSDRQLGFTLELITERNPYQLHAGAKLPLRLIYENRPLTGALVVAINRLNPSQKISARTDSHGRVTLPLKAAGMWLVKAVHMVPAAAGTQADWQSYWASVTFELPAPATKTEPVKGS